MCQSFIMYSEFIVEHLNLSLKKHRLEPLYGFFSGNHDDEVNGEKYKKLEDLAKQFSAPAVPLKPSLALHWLAVNGTQPAIPENPVILSDKAQQELKTLPKEFQNLYVRIVGALLQATDKRTKEAVLDILRQDQCLQPLVPLLARFFYTQIKAHSRSQPVSHLVLLLDALVALQSNPHVALEAHLTQLLPGIFTLVAAPVLGIEHAEASSSSSTSSSLQLHQLNTQTHWSLRRRAAECVALILRRYHHSFPDLLPRVCRTYIDALNPPSQSLATVFGGVAGLMALGEEPLRQLLLPQLPNLKRLIIDSVETRDTVHTQQTDETQAVEMDVDDTVAGGVSQKKRAFHQLSAAPAVTAQSRRLRHEEALQCRAVLGEALGRLQRAQLPLCVAGHTGSSQDTELCDLEELLGVFLAAQSPHTVPHAFLSL